MFDTLVSPLLEIIQEKLRSNVLQEIVGDVCGLRDDLNEFGNSIRTIQLHLHDAEVKQRKNEHLNNWLRELKDIAYEAEDLLEVLTPEFLRRNGESERGKDLKVFLINMLNQSYGGSSIPTRVKAVRVKSEAIANRMFIFNLEEGIIGHQIGEFKEIKDNELDICGRQEEKDMIIERVVHLMQDQDNLSVHALCGVGGIGKTTLAKLVYEDERVKSHFQLQIWVRVSSDFSINKSVRSIIESMEKTQCDICALDPLQQLLKEKLRDKKFLLVLDDVWTEDFREWDGLKGILRCGSKGSVVLVTTRIEKVAIMMGSINIQHIPFLSEHDSWSMFRKRAFADKSGDETLEGIGKEIVRKCWGIPLAIKALGSLMMYKTTEVEWRAVQDNEIWQLVDDDGILPSLRLAYDDMPPHVKQCFAHCCSFPKDHYMKKDELIQLWMANGFIPFDGNIDLPSAGYSIFQELVSRSFIQDVKKDFRGNTECKMHDLMHDLAQSVMRNETYILERRKFPHNPKILRHLVLPVVRGPMLKFSLAVEVSLRSLCVHEEEQLASGQSFSSFLSKQHYLRVLETNSHNLLDIVCKLSHLRYLVMTCDGLERLPESIVGLYNLQTLKLEKSEQLRELPKNLKCMTNIYFLEIDDFSSLDSMPPKLGDLTCLQRLSVFLVGKDSSHQIHQLKDLDLGGELTIQMLNNVRNSEDAISANLIAKKNLHSLNLSWESDDRTEEHFDEVLEGLKPNPNLENISIEFFPGSRFPHWISPLCLKNLKKISLKNCRECERISPLGQFPVLRDITLIGMDSIKSLDAKWHGDGETSFPALEHLTLERLPNLMEWTIPKGNNHFSSLKSLNIFHCDYLRNLPQNLSVESLCITHCDNFEIPRFFVLERPPEAIQLQYAESKHPKRKSMLNITRRVLAGDAKKDGYSWTKLCQKYILGFRYPRLYYRCTYRHSQGCQASKQVQRAEDDPSMMIITYRAAHNCSPNQNQEITPLQSAIGIKFPEGMGKPTFIENFSSSGSVITSIESNSATKETPQKRNRGKEQSSRERKSKVKGTVRVAATGLQVDDIPTDEFSWRKYGVKPIFGSVYPRAYYKCSTVRGCPARKHVEREIDDPSMWIVTYSGEHSHAQDQNQEIAPVHSAKEIKLPESMGKPTVIGNYSSRI